MLKKIFGGFSVMGLAMFAYVSTISTPVCSCIPAASGFKHRTGAHPLDDPPEQVRAALLKIVPIGSTEEQLRQFLGGLNHSFHRCRRERELICRFEARKSYWVTEGYEMAARFDSASRLEDVRFAPYKDW